MSVLYAHCIERQVEEWRFQASLRGIKIKDPEEKKSKPGEDSPSTTPFAFGDLSEYAHMSDAEKQALTDKMMSGHKQWKEGGARGIK